MSEIRRLVLSGDPEAAARLLPTLGEPSAADLTWGGYALIIAGQRPQAELLLRRARAQGDGQALVFLALLKLEQGDTEQAEACLSAAQDRLDTPEAQATYWRERARLGTVRGETRETVLDAAHRAWEACALADTSVQVAVAQYVGFLWMYYGEPATALPYLEFAGEVARPHQQDAVRLTLADTLASLGRQEEAREQWQAITQPVYRWKAQLMEASYQAAQGHLGRALALTDELAQQTWPHPRSELDILKQRLTLELQAGLPGFTTSLIRARQLTLTPVDRLLLDFWEGVWQARSGDPVGLSTLQQVARQQNDMGATMPALLTTLALAQFDPSWQEQHLTRAAELAARLPETLRRTLGEQAYGPLLTGAVALLRQRPTGDPVRQLLLHEAAAPALRLETLGAATFFRNGEPLRLRMSRSAEVVAYLLQSGPVTLGTLLTDLFPDTPAARAQNYFHQLRSDLAERLPEVQIVYRKDRRLYHLETASPLSWDVAELRTDLGGNVSGEALLERPLGPFLPLADSEWATRFRQHLTDELLRVALPQIRDLLRRDEAARALALSEKLLALDPLSPPLLRLSVQAEAAAHGEESARQRLYRVQQLCERELGEVPAELALGAER